MSGYPQAIVPVDHVEPVPRRVRAELAGHVVLDTTQALYLWEWPAYPQFLIPVDDVDPEALVDEGHVSNLSRGRVARVGLRAGDVERKGAGRRFVESTLPGLVDTIRFDWAALDAWYEEDEQIFVHPRNPDSRVDALRSGRAVRIELDGLVLAESSAPVAVFETGLPPRWYLERTAVDFTHLRPSDTETACPYKGRTTGYWSVQTSEALYPDLAWTYDFPTAPLLPIAGLVAFYDEKVDVFLDGVEQERPVTPFSS
jgi:uncharacterized protein (DUF427 family)